MDDAIGESLTFAGGVAVSPVPITGVLLMLGTPRARSNGPAFALGWLAGLTLVGTVVLVISNGAETSSEKGSFGVADAVKLVLGLLFAVLALRQWRGRPRRGEQP